jgi:hypothetical protein
MAEARAESLVLGFHIALTAAVFLFLWMQLALN